MHNVVVLWGVQIKKCIRIAYDKTCHWKLVPVISSLFSFSCGVGGGHQPEEN
jgi:hypothetical protein